LAARDVTFFDIVSRGSLLYVVSQLWERDKLSRYAGRINSALVMDLFINHSYRRQSEKVAQGPDFMVLNQSERAYFMIGIAGYMGALNLPNQISRELFDKAVKTLYEVIPESISTQVDGLPTIPRRPLKERLRDTEDPVQDVSNDVRSSGILVFDQSKSGALRFAHKSFMEFLVASLYGAYLVGRNRESSAALMAASHLDAEHLLHHPESVTFLGEILTNLGGRGDDQKPPQLNARLLFELIAVVPNGHGFLAEMRARVALQSLKARAFAFGRRQESNIFQQLVWTQVAKMFRPEMLSLLLFVVALELISAANLSKRHAIYHSQAVLLLGALVSMISGFGAALTITYSRNSIYSVHLWFLCCLTSGMDLEAIGTVAGLWGLTELANDLVPGYKFKETLKSSSRTLN
jgi:hypothetical protein